MDNKDPASDGATGSRAVGRDKGRLAKLGRLVGIGGALVCSLSMVAAAVGLFVAGSTRRDPGDGGHGLRTPRWEGERRLRPSRRVRAGRYGGHGFKAPRRSARAPGRSAGCGFGTP
jgi:hypothetical protein